MGLAAEARLTLPVLAGVGDPAGHLLAGSDDELVAGADSQRGTYWGVDLSRDGRWLVISSAVGTACGSQLTSWLASRS